MVGIEILKKKKKKKKNHRKDTELGGGSLLMHRETACPPVRGHTGGHPGLGRGTGFLGHHEL